MTSNGNGASPPEGADHAAQAASALAQLFFDILSEDRSMTFERFEQQALTAGHDAMARAMAQALERLDSELCQTRHAGQHVHDTRRRTLITEIGDVSFSYHRMRDAHGRTTSPLSDALGIPTNRQVSPGALSFLAEAGAELSYASAARLLARKGGSQVSAMTAMRALRQAVDEDGEAVPAPSPAGKARKQAASRRKHGQSLARTSERSRLAAFQQNRPHASMRGVIAFSESDLQLFQQLCRRVMERRGMTGSGSVPSPLKGAAMGSYEREQQLIASGAAERGYTAKKYFEELDAQLTDETSSLSHRPDYSKTLFAPENDDIYREFCAYVDLPTPRFFDAIKDPIRVEGYSAADVYFAMKSKNPRIVEIDGAAVYNMLVKLRTQPAIAKKVLDFIPTCYQGGCGKGDAAFERGYYDKK